MGYDVPPERDALSRLASPKALSTAGDIAPAGRTAARLFSLDQAAIVSTMRTLLQADKYSGCAKGDPANEAENELFVLWIFMSLSSFLSNRHLNTQKGFTLFLFFEKISC